MRLFLLSALVIGLGLPAATGQELSEKATRAFMEYAWFFMPTKCRMSDGETIRVKKTKREGVVVSLDRARAIIRAGRLSAHAVVCNLPTEELENWCSLLGREVQASKPSDGQILYIRSLHDTVTSLLLGKIKLVEKKKGKEIVIDKNARPDGKCTEEQRATVRGLIGVYVKTGPDIAACVASRPRSCIP